MNLVDSSGWLEYFADGPNAVFFSAPIANVSQLLVPTISVYEVFKRMLQQRGENDALAAVAFMHRGAIMELTATLALSAAKVSLETRLPMADSVMLATARANGAVLWTQDAHFDGLTGVRYRVARPEA